MLHARQRGAAAGRCCVQPQGAESPPLHLLPAAGMPPSAAAQRSTLPPCRPPAVHLPRCAPPLAQFAGAVAYAALNELLFQPKEYQVGRAAGPFERVLCTGCALWLPRAALRCLAAAAAPAHRAVMLPPASTHCPSPCPATAQCFNHTLSKIKDDPRITVRLGAQAAALCSPAAAARLLLRTPPCWGSHHRPAAAAEGCPAGPCLPAWQGAAAAAPLPPRFAAAPAPSHPHTLHSAAAAAPAAGTPISAYGQESQNRAARQRIPHRQGRGCWLARRCVVQPLLPAAARPALRRLRPCAGQTAHTPAEAITLHLPPAAPPAGCTTTARGGSTCSCSSTCAGPAGAPP